MLEMLERILKEGVIPHLDVAELIKELSALDQNKPIWIHYDMAYSQTPEISVADADTYDCDNRIKPGDYII